VRNLGTAWLDHILIRFRARETEGAGGGTQTDMRNQGRDKELPGRGTWSVKLAVAIVIVGVLHGAVPASASLRQLRQTCISVATSQPHVYQAVIDAHARYTGTYSYKEEDFLKGSVEPLPAECSGLYGRSLTDTVEVQNPANHAAWLGRGEDLLVAQPNSPFEGPTFSFYIVIGKISPLYAGAHEPHCQVHPAPCYRGLTKEHLHRLRAGAWRAVRKWGLYVCSKRSLRPPLLRGRRSARGGTRARIVFHAKATDLHDHHRTLAEKTFIRPMRVKGAC
jgi:hypothetical protein